MLTVKRRLGAGFATLMLLFLAAVLVQLFINDSLRAAQDRRAAELAEARDANRHVLQHMTDAETGVRGFQLTGERIFLAPYESGRVGAIERLDRIGALSGDAEVRRLVGVERLAAVNWLSAYAVPIVYAGVADRDGARAARGKAMFDRLRAANADVDAALRAQQRATTAADRRQSRTAQVLFSAVAVAFLVAALGLAVVYRRQLLTPLEQIGHTLQRLAAGDRSARAVPAGPAEMRAVIASLNSLAAQTEQLLDAEQARAARHELRQAVAAALRDHEDPQAAAHRVIELIGGVLGAGTVQLRAAIDGDAGADACWPAGAVPRPAGELTEALARRSGTVVPVADTPGAIAVALAGDHDCPPGVLYLVRADHPGWTPDERRLLAAIGREIDHAVRTRRLQVRQARLISELRMLDERKDAFVATVTHELRTPLTSILGYSEMLAEGDGGELSALQKRGVAAILRNAERLQDTVANLLLLDRAAGHAVGGVTPVDLAALTAGVAADAAPQAQAKDLTVTLDGGPVWVSGDARQLGRALRNLVDNAIKFTGAGGRVSCSVSRDGDHARIVVADTGIGIPADDLPALFTPFHRAANAMDQAVQGPGLGLAIVRTIVTDHGGAVTVRSALGEGSTVTVTLPVLRAEPAPVDLVAGEAV